MKFKLTRHALIIITSLPLAAIACGEHAHASADKVRLAQFIFFDSSQGQAEAERSQRSSGESGGAEMPVLERKASPPARSNQNKNQAKARRAEDSPQRNSAQAPGRLTQKARTFPRLPITAPLPPPRPSGDLTDTGQPSQAVDREFGVTPPNDIVDLIAPPAAPTNTSRERNMLLLVRPELSSAKDLEGRKVVVWSSDLSSDDVQHLLSKGAGVNSTAISKTFAAGLDGLARGEVDAVLIAVGPRMSRGETEGLRLSPFRLIEVALPISSAASSTPAGRQ